MDIALNWKDYFPKVDTLIENLIYNINKEADRVQISDKYAKLDLKLKKKVYVSPRGSLRSFKIDGKPVGNVHNAAFTLTYGQYETINISNDIQNNPELFSFVPITKNDEVRYTVSKYSPFFEKYFDPNAENIEVIYTFATMFVRVEEAKKVKAYLFDLNANGLSVHSIFKYFCKEGPKKYDPFKNLYIGTLDKVSNVIAIGYTKANFKHIKSIKQLMRFFQTNFIKYCLAYDYDTRRKNLDTIKSYIATICLERIGFDEDDFCMIYGINKEELYDLIDLKKETIINDAGQTVTLDKILEYLQFDEKVTRDYNSKSNLLKEVTFEEIPN